MVLLLEVVHDFLCPRPDRLIGVLHPPFSYVQLLLDMNRNRPPNPPGEIVQALIEKGAEVNAKDVDGRTALMLAASAGHAVFQVLEPRFTSQATESWSYSEQENHVRMLLAGSFQLRERLPSVAEAHARGGGHSAL